MLEGKQFTTDVEYSFVFSKSHIFNRIPCQPCLLLGFLGLLLLVLTSFYGRNDRDEQEGEEGGVEKGREKIEDEEKYEGKEEKICFF